MNQFAIVGQDVDRAAEILRAGGLVAVPTETVYGLAANAFDEQAVARIFAAKKRPSFDPLIVHVPDQPVESKSLLQRLVTSVPKAYQPLISRFWPGPLTLVFEKSEAVPLLVTSGLPTVAVRCPAHSVTQQLLKTAGIPLAAPGANLFGRTSPTRPEHVAEQLRDRIDYILDAGPCTVGVESTILRWHDGRYEILRPGGIPREELETELQQKVSVSKATDDSAQAVVSPGQLKEHYAPRTPLIINEQPERLEIPAQAALLTFLVPPTELAEKFARVVSLSPEGDLAEAAAKFFAAIHELDAGNYQQIIATPFPETGLGVALNDRLQRAAHQ